ncbi:hypothetical protein LG634_16735 [Streptomyces bambusae]|uniref:hypothetical protein n=1 Tax=Streptomyces bambusae TaxID=1550616 RepID=UPI001CFE9EE0|nr:hypothetical protein [Streptomyces bambusae]MCB5166479.1 hypothetical protein [Streptomyces bambusae]
MAHRARTLVLTLVGTVVVLAVSVPVAVTVARSWLDGRHDMADTFETGREAKEERKTMPRWLPDNATDVTWNWKTTGDERLLKAQLPTAALPAGCRTERPAVTPDVPKVKSDWFPEDAARRATARCEGGYHAYLDGRTLTAWLTADDALRNLKNKQ